MALEVDEEYKEMEKFFDRCGLEILRTQRENDDRLYVIRKKKH